MDEKIITLENLITNVEETKNYIKTREVWTGLTEDEVQGMIDASDNNVKISEDNAYEPLEMEV